MEKDLADILADEKAFNGSDIDVAISSRASALALATHDADIKSLVGTLDQSADISLSSLARSLAVWDVSTKLAALVVGDKDNPSVDEQALLTALRKLFHVDLVDDDDVADAKMDFTAYSTIIVGYSADVAKLSALTNLAIPLVFVVGEHAATIGKMATVGAGNYGTSTGTQWSLADNSHPTLLTETLGTHDIYTQSGNFGWLLSTALASGVGVFATVQGEATHVSLAILPIDGINSDGLTSPEIRYFFGAQEPSKYTSHTWDHVKWIGDWLSHQIALVTLVTSLEKSKTIEEMLGKGKFQKTRDLYDYLVTGTTGSPPFEVIAEYESRSVMERLEWIKNALRKGTGTALPANKSLYDILWVDRSLDESGSFNWDTSVYLTNETDISALFTTPLTGTTRRKYWVYLDMTNPAADAAWATCTVKVQVDIDGTGNYRTIDKATKSRTTDLVSTAEPGIPIEIPMVARNVKITLQFDVALSVDKTIYYHVVQEKLEY